MTPNNNTGPDSMRDVIKKLDYWLDAVAEQRLKILRELLSEEESSTSFRSVMLSDWIAELEAKKNFRKKEAR